MTRTTVGALAAVLLLAGVPAGAQDSVQISPAPASRAPAPASSTRGFFLGFHLNGSGVEVKGVFDEVESGGGFGFQLGYGFTPRLAMFVELTGAALSDARLDQQPGGATGLGHGDLGVRYAFTGPTRKLVPSLELALTSRALVQDNAEFPDGGIDDYSLTGGGLSFGGGVQYYFTPKVALGAGLKWSTGEFDVASRGTTSESGLGLEGVSSRLNIMLTWYPRGGR